jgi:hypothetical protein
VAVRGRSRGVFFYRDAAADVRRPARPGPGRGAGRGGRWRHRRESAGHAGRAGGDQCRAAPARRRDSRHRDGVLRPGAGRAGVRSRLRVRARLHVAVRLGAADRGRRTVDALPDVRLRLGRDAGRPAPPAPGQGRDSHAGRVRRGGRLPVRVHAQPLVLALLRRPVELHRVPAGAVLCRAVASLPALRRNHLTGLGHRPRGHQRAGHPHRRARRAGRIPPRRAPGELPARRHLRPGPRRRHRRRLTR